MRQQQAFYKRWLMPKFQSYCDQLAWMDNATSAHVNLTDEELEQELRMSGSH
jgi:hypothetical protein